MWKFWKKKVRRLRDLFLMAKEAGMSESVPVSFAGEFLGHRIRVFESINYMPTKRYLTYLANQNEGELGVGRDDLNAFVKGIRDAVKTMDMSRIGWYAETLDFYINQQNPERVLFKTGSLFILIDDENPHEVSPKHQELKAQLFSNDDEFRAFFLKTTFALLRKYGILSGDMSEGDFLSLEKSREERIYSQLMGRPIFMTSMSG